MPSVIDSEVMQKEEMGMIVETENQNQNAAPAGDGHLLKPMSPFVASATVVNLLLATGPFTYPYAYVSLGPVISAPLLFITAIFAHVSATYIVEACSIAQLYKEDDGLKERKASVF